MRNTEPYLAAAMNSAAIVVDAIMVYVLLRDPTSYFRSYRNYFVAIYAAFFAFPIRELLLLFYPDESVIRLSTQLMMSGAVGIALLWGHMVTKLYFYPETFSIRSALANPSTPIHFSYITYLIPMIATLVVAWADPATIDTNPLRVAYYISDGISYRAVGYSTLFLVVAGTVAVAFTLYPLLTLVHLRAQLKDQEVRHALKVFATSFGTISVILLVGHGLSSMGLDFLAIDHLTSVILLIVAVRAFERSTFLKAFLGVVPSLESSHAAVRGDQMVLIYSSEEERLGPISKYMNEGVNMGNRVIYFHNDDEALLRESLSRRGIDVRQQLLKGNLRMFPRESLYQTQGLWDEEAALGTCQELAAEARSTGKQGLTIIIDYDEDIERPWNKFLRHVTDARWTVRDHYVKVLMAFAKSAFQGQEGGRAALRSKIPILDVTESLDLFSRTVGLSHSEIAGKKILLEFDPLSDYERVLKSLLAEAASNFERIALFTRRDSPVLSFVGEEPGLKMFILTSRVSYPKVEKENRVLLPAYDSSLLLDSLNKTIEAYIGASFTIVFDNISHYVFSLGPDRALSLVQQALELMVSDKITAVFLLNAGAHDHRIVSIFENLFDVELVSKAGARTTEVRKRLGVSAS